MAKRRPATPKVSTNLVKLWASKQSVNEISRRTAKMFIDEAHNDNEAFVAATGILASNTQFNDCVEMLTEVFDDKDALTKRLLELYLRALTR